MKLSSSNPAVGAGEVTAGVAVRLRDPDGSSRRRRYAGAWRPAIERCGFFGM